MTTLYCLAALWAVALVILYFLPTIIWKIRTRKFSWVVFMVNLLCGWFPILYVIMVYNAVQEEPEYKVRKLK